MAGLDGNPTHSKCLSSSSLSGKPGDARGKGLKTPRMKQTKTREKRARANGVGVGHSVATAHRSPANAFSVCSTYKSASLELPVGCQSTANPGEQGKQLTPTSPMTRRGKNRREARATPQRPGRWTRSAGPGLPQARWGEAGREGEERTVKRVRGPEEHREAAGTARAVFKNPCL